MTMSAEGERRAEARRRHRDAVLDVEVRLLMDVLGPFGVMRREQLARRAKARLWQTGTFDEALSRAVERGLVRRIAYGFVARCEPGDAGRLPGRMVRRRRPG